jgi:hypothetical protein
MMEKGSVVEWLDRRRMVWRTGRYLGTIEKSKHRFGLLRIEPTCHVPAKEITVTSDEVRSIEVGL